MFFRNIVPGRVVVRVWSPLIHWQRRLWKTLWKGACLPDHESSLRGWLANRLDILWTHWPSWCKCLYVLSHTFIHLWVIILFTVLMNILRVVAKAPHFGFKVAMLDIRDLWTSGGSWVNKQGACNYWGSRVTTIDFKLAF